MDGKVLLRFTGLLFLVGLSTGGRRNSFTRVVKFDDFAECNKHGVNRIENVTVGMVGRGKYVINLSFIVTKTINGGKLWFTTNKCKSTSLNDCERYLRYSADFCNLVLEDGQAWTTFLKNAYPKFKCPMKPNTYKFINASLDATEMMSIGSVLPIEWFEAYFWKIKFELIDNKESLACGTCILSYQRIRDH